MTDLLSVCRLAARQCITAWGAMHNEEEIRGMAPGIAAGLFGRAFERATPEQQSEWVKMCEDEYRALVCNQLIR